MDKTEWIKKNCKFAQAPRGCRELGSTHRAGGWTRRPGVCVLSASDMYDYNVGYSVVPKQVTAQGRDSYSMQHEQEQEWREQQMAPFATRIDDDPESPEGDSWLIDGGAKYKLLKDQDPQDGSPAWSILEFNGTEWGLTDQDYELADLMSRIDSVGNETDATGLPSQGMQPAAPQQPDPASRLYDLHGMGAKMTPEQAAEYKTLSDQHKQQNGRLPGYMASWVRKNCRFAQMSADPNVRALADQAWDYIDAEDQYQTDYRMHWGKPSPNGVPAQQLEADKQTLMAAEASGNSQAITSLIQKYKAVHDAAKSQSEAVRTQPPQ